MRISFDIDETLVIRGIESPIEPGLFPGPVQRWLCEPLRHGTSLLMRELRRRGCSLWIYTSSARTPFEIRLWLLLHGLGVDGIVNDDRHRHELGGRSFSRMPSKFPPAFGIDLHVDDSEGVKMEGLEHGFSVLVIRPDDDDWTKRVLEAVSPSGQSPKLSRVTISKDLR